MKFRLAIIAILAAAFLLPPSTAHAGRVNVPVAQVVVQNNEAGRRVSNNLLDIRGDSPAKKVKEYLKKRYRPTGGDQVLFIKINRATVLHQGQTALGRDKYYVDITLDVSLASKPYMPSKKARVRYGRHVESAGPSFVGSNLPTRASANLVKAAIRSIDRKLIKALHHELDIL